MAKRESSDEGKKLVEKLLKLHIAKQVLKAEYRDKEDAIDHEIETLLSGGDGIGATLKRLEEHYALLWAVRYAPTWAPGDKGGYSWNFSQDRSHWKRLIRTIGVEELEMRAINYLKDPDPFYVRSRHAFNLFVKDINRFTSSADQHANDFELKAPVIGCTHVPPCATDQAHTKRRNEDMRAYS